MSDATQLDNVLARIEKRERSSRFRTFLYTIIPTCLAAVLVISYVSWTSAKQRQLDAALLAEANARLGAEEARGEELKEQVRGLMDGPVQAYVRPGRFGGDLVVAKELVSARKILEEFDSSQVGSIRTSEISNILSSIRELLGEARDWTSAHGELSQLVLRLGQACRHAWDVDKEALASETIYEFNRLLYDRAIETTKRIASADDYHATVESRDEFRRLYWGELPLIETLEVAAAMVRFRRALDEWSEGIKPGDLDFEERAKDVAAACAAALAKDRGA